MVGTVRAVVVAVGVLVAGPAQAELPPPPLTAAEVLASVEQHYAGVGHLRASFRHTLTQGSSSTTQDGTLFVTRTGLFRWEYKQQRHGRVRITRSVIFDGTTRWLIDHGAKQLVQDPPIAVVLSPALEFMTAASTLGSRYTTALAPSTADAHRLELTPTQSSSTLAKLTFVVSQRDGHVTEAIVEEPSGDIHRISFFAPDRKTPVRVQWFQVSPATLRSYTHVTARPRATPTPAPPSSSPSP